MRSMVEGFFLGLRKKDPPPVIPAKAGIHEHRCSKPRTAMFMDPGSSPG
jgi:hypothetical protein